jgi:hypothetical protein
VLPSSVDPIKKNVTFDSSNNRGEEATILGKSDGNENAAVEQKSFVCHKFTIFVSVIHFSLKFKIITYCFVFLLVSSYILTIQRGQTYLLRLLALMFLLLALHRTGQSYVLAFSLFF